MNTTELYLKVMSNQGQQTEICTEICRPEARSVEDCVQCAVCSRPINRGITPPPSYHRSSEIMTNNSSISDLGAPPTYEDVIDPNAPPPSYDSLFGRVRDAHRSSKGIIDFLKNILIILLGTLGCSIVLGITIVVPVSMIVIGSIYLNDCPQGEYIPVYLVVGGGFGIVKQLLHLSTRVRQSEDEREEERLRQSPTQTLINCFMLGWFIIGSVLVYKEYEPNYDSKLPKYCNRTLYLFAFWLNTSVYIMLGLISMCMFSICIANLVFQRDT